MCPKRLRCKLAPRSTSRAVEVAGMMTEMKLGMSAVSAAVADREVGPAEAGGSRHRLVMGAAGSARRPARVRHRPASGLVWSGSADLARGGDPATVPRPPEPVAGRNHHAGHHPGTEPHRRLEPRSGDGIDASAVLRSGVAPGCALAGGDAPDPGVRADRCGTGVLLRLPAPDWRVGRTLRGCDRGSQSRA